MVIPLMTASPQPALAADVAVYGILKSQQFFQANAGAPVALASNGFAFKAFVFASGDHLVTNATVKPSNSTPLRQLLGGATQAVWQFEQRFSSQVDLNNVYPSGTILSPIHYTNTMKTVNDGTKTSVLSLAGVLGNPPTLQVSNFAAAQSINPAADFTLRWKSAGGQSIDLVQLLVFDSASNTVFASPERLAPGALTGQSNAVVIPAFALPSVASLTARLSDCAPAPCGHELLSRRHGPPALVKDIEFPMATRTMPARPRLEILSANADPFQLRYTGEPHLTYYLQMTHNFISWTNLFVTNPPTGTGTYIDSTSSLTNRRYYRIELGQ